MLCPRCQVLLSEGQCPSCGIVWDPEYGSEGRSDVGQAAGGSISFEVLETRARPAGSATADWRKELRRRLEEHSGKSKIETEGGESADDSAAAMAPDAGSPSPAKPDESRESASKLFDYQLKRPQGKRPLTNPVRQKNETTEPASRKPKSASLERPVTREEKSVPKRSKTPGDVLPRPLQRKLNLESPASLRVPTGLPKDAPTPTQPAVSRSLPPSLSREILLSRFLAGIIDVTVPLALGMSFALVAAWRIGFDFFAYGSLRMALLFSLGFYLFNSIFFLLLSGQTPGMYAAQLRLADSEGEDDVAVASIVLRVLLFIPSCLTLIGLLWSVFDPERRCLHDVLSGSNVVGSDQVPEARRAPRRL